MIQFLRYPAQTVCELECLHIGGAREYFPKALPHETSLACVVDDLDGPAFQQPFQPGLLELLITQRFFLRRKLVRFRKQLPELLHAHRKTLFENIAEVSDI